MATFEACTVVNPISNQDSNGTLLLPVFNGSIVVAESTSSTGDVEVPGYAQVTFN